VFEADSISTSRGQATSESFLACSRPAKGKI
jgi:hypothetical protein